MGAASAITSVMNLWVPRSMPLAQATSGVAVGEMRGERGDRGAQILRRRRDQDQLGLGGEPDIVRHRDGRIECVPRAILDCCAWRRSRLRLRVARAENHVASGARGNAGQRGPPRAGADDGD